MNHDDANRMIARMQHVFPDWTWTKKDEWIRMSTTTHMGLSLNGGAGHASSQIVEGCLTDACETTWKVGIFAYEGMNKPCTIMVHRQPKRPRELVGLLPSGSSDTVTAMANLCEDGVNSALLMWGARWTERDDRAALLADHLRLIDFDITLHERLLAERRAQQALIMAELDEHKRWLLVQQQLVDELRLKEDVLIEEVVSETVAQAIEARKSVIGILNMWMPTADWVVNEVNCEWSCGQITVCVKMLLHGALADKGSQYLATISGATGDVPTIKGQGSSQAEAVYATLISVLGVQDYQRARRDHMLARCVGEEFE